MDQHVQSGNRKLARSVTFGLIIPENALCSLPKRLVRSVRIFHGERVVPRASALVQDGVIRAVGVNLRTPGNAEVVNGGGKTLLAGLIDAHTYTATAGDLKQVLAFDVTTELDIFSRPANIAALRRALELKEERRCSSSFK